MTHATLSPSDRRELEADALYQLRTCVLLDALDEPIKCHLVQHGDSGIVVMLVAAQPASADDPAMFRYYHIEAGEFGTIEQVWRYASAAASRCQAYESNTGDLHHVCPVGEFHAVRRVEA